MSRTVDRQPACTAPRPAAPGRPDSKARQSAWSVIRATFASAVIIESATGPLPRPGAFPRSVSRPVAMRTCSREPGGRGRGRTGHAHCTGPPLPHLPGIGFVARRGVTNVAVGQAKTGNAPGDAVPNPRNPLRSFASARYAGRDRLPNGLRRRWVSVNFPPEPPRR